MNDMPSSSPQSKTIRWIVLLLFLIPVIVNLFTFYDGHNWGEDFSQYIINADNIIHGRPFASGIMIKPSVVYPPGFPLLLAPLYKLVGLNFVVLKSFNMLFWYGTIALLYPLCLRRLTKTQSVLLCLVFAYFSQFFSFKQNVLSDIPFMFLCTAALFFFDKYESSQNDSQSRRFFGLFILTISYALFTRTIGISLFLAAGYYFLFIKRGFRKLVIAIVAAMSTLTIQTLWIGVNPAGVRFLLSNFAHYMQQTWEHAPLVLFNFVHTYNSAESLAGEVLLIGMGKTVIFLSIVIYAVILLLFIKTSIRRTISYMGSFSFFYLLFVLVWTGMETRGMGRFCLPILGPILIFICAGINWLENNPAVRRLHVDPKNLVNLFFLIMIAINVMNTAANFRFNDDDLLKGENKELFQWVKENIHDNEHYVFHHPRVMALMTKKIGTAIWVVLQDGPMIVEKMIEHLKEYDIDYCIMTNGIDDRFRQTLDENPQQAQLVWQNNLYRIYHLL